jgi:flavin-dependent dehydrogenase
MGAGPCGSAASNELARCGFSTALVGRSSDQRPNVGECLPPDIRPQLEKAGVWEEFQRAGHIPSTGIRAVWGSPQFTERDFVLSPYGAGWHVDRSRFDEMMRDSALRSGAKWLDCKSLRDVELDPQGWRIRLPAQSGDCSVIARFVIDATGRSSVFARRVGAKRNLLDHLTGVAGYFSSAENHPIEPVLLVEAVENGWWYTAPLPEGKLIAVYMTDAEFIQRQKLTQAEIWMEQLNVTIEQSKRIKEHGFRLEGGLRVMQAESSFLNQVAGEGWLAAGDAAAAFDPLSSQGITTAISSGLDAARTASAWLAGNRDAVTAYARRMRETYAEYLAHRNIYYRMEQRWPENNFWKSRQQRKQVAPAGEAACA